jgi:hypothetical protein
MLRQWYNAAVNGASLVSGSTGVLTVSSRVESMLFLVNNIAPMVL